MTALEQAEVKRLETRLVIHAPTGKDGRLLLDLFAKASICSHICNNAEMLVREIEKGACALIIADDALTTNLIRGIVDYLSSQASWSDLPIIILTTPRRESTEASRRYLQLGNVTLIERPAQSVTLISAATAALRARHRQYEMRDIDRRKDEFLAMLAHELRNPLAPVSAAAALLKLPNLDKARIAKTSDIISRQVSHMTELIDDLLDVSRVSRGLVTLEKNVLDAREVLTSAVEQVRPLIEQRGHNLSIQLPFDAVSIEGDRKRLIQIVANLLNNSAKYTPTGGNIYLSLEVADSTARIRVNDNGIGMDSATIKHVFGMFTQAARTPDRTQGGLGIGLALVKSLVMLHEGTVEATSDGPNTGCTFLVSLRIADVLPNTSEQCTEAALVPPGRPEKVLIVDDNNDAAEMLSLYLETAGYETCIEHTGLGGINRAESFVPDVLLLDIGLPDMDGMEVAKRLRKAQQISGTLMIAITGYGQASDSRNAINAGFDYHMVKPVQLVELLATMAAHAKNLCDFQGK